MAKFQTEPVDQTMVLIKRDDDTVAGSICRVGDHWHVEILWSGPTGDIVYDAPSLPLALAFLDGVEKAFEAMEATQR
jgi:hypothetical protein